MSNLALSIKKPIPLTLILGILGGIGLILPIMLTTNGPAIFISYALLVIVTFAALRIGNLSSLGQRFSTAFLAFMLATIILYVFIGSVEAGSITKISVFGHAWRLGLMAVIGGSLSLNVAVLADIGFKPISAAFFALMLVGLAHITIANEIIVGFIAMTLGTLGLNVVCLVNIIRKYEA